MAGAVRAVFPPEQEEALKAYVARTLPRSTRQIGAFIERDFGVVHESRAGLIALLHQLGLGYHKPDVIGRRLRCRKTARAFIESYEKLLNALGADGRAVHDAVHPTHAARPVSCQQPKENLAIEQTSGRQRINVHGAIGP